MDSHDATGSPDDLHGWLCHRLRAERAAVARQLEEQHKVLLSEVENRFSTESTRRSLSFVSSETVATPKVRPAWEADFTGVTPTDKHKDDFKRGKRSIPTVVTLFRNLEDSELQLRPSAPGVHSAYARFETFVKSQTFEWIFAGVILLNALFMAMHLQYKGIDIGYGLQYRTYNRPASDTWPEANKFLIFIDDVFTALFTIEVLMRIVAYRSKWLCMSWSYIDAVIVGLGIFAWISPRPLSLNPTVVRLIRFGKLMRIVRIMRSNKLLDSLKILVTAIQSSLHTLFWSLLTLLVIQSVAGMMLVQFLDEFMNDESEPLDVRQRVFSYYGTFWRAMVTMFEITFANWAPPCRLLLDHVDEAYGIFFLIYRCMIGFAVLSVIQAVFIQQTMKAAQDDEHYVLEEKERERRRNAEKLGKIFEKMDQSGDGYVNWSEFEPILKEEQFKLMMSTIGVDVSDLEMLFQLLDNGDGEFSSQDFVRGMAQVKGPAKAVDMVTLMQTAKRIEAKLDGGGWPAGFGDRPTSSK